MPSAGPRFQQPGFVPHWPSVTHFTPNDHRHFELVRYNEETNKDDQIHCMIFNSRRSAITTALTEGRQVAVAGQLSLYPPQGSGSILVDEVASVDGDGDDAHPFEIIRANRRVQIAIATGLLLAALAVVVLLVL